MTLQLCRIVCLELQANQTDAERRQEIELSHWATLTGQILLTLPLSDVQNVHRLKGTKEQRWYFPTENCLLIEGISLRGKQTFFWPWQNCVNSKLTAWTRKKSKRHCAAVLPHSHFLQLNFTTDTVHAAGLVRTSLWGCHWQPGPHQTNKWLSNYNFNIEKKKKLQRIMAADPVLSPAKHRSVEAHTLVSSLTITSTTTS